MKTARSGSFSTAKFTTSRICGRAWRLAAIAFIPAPTRRLSFILYEEAGPSCVAKLNGIFAFAILDLSRDFLFLARDPIGVKPLFYAASREHFLFGSEIKAILASSRVTPTMNRQAVSDFFTFLYVPGPETAFEGIVQLPPAHSLTLSLGDFSISMKRYWEVPPRDEIENSSYDQLKSRIRENLAASVKRQLVSDVPLGVFLSGGIDSTIVAGLAKKEKADIQTYTLALPGEEYRFYNEAEKGRAVSRHLGTEHFELPGTARSGADIGPRRILRSAVRESHQLPHARAFAEGARTISPSRYAARAAMNSSQAIQGPPPCAWQKLGWLPRPFLRCGGSLLGPLRDSHRHPHLRRARKFLDGLDADFLVQYSNWTYFLNEAEKQLLLHGRSGTETARNGVQPSVNVLRAAFDLCSLPDLDNRVLELDLKTFLADNVLEYTDRMSMATALEVRVPLLDSGFVEMGLNTPFAYKIRSGNPKAILVDAFAEFFPPAVRNAPKRGFNAPLGRWIGPLFDDYFQASLERSRPSDGKSWRGCRLLMARRNPRFRFHPATASGTQPGTTRQFA